jgi:transcriptional regulator with XRE-family HTH domain
MALPEIDQVIGKIEDWRKQQGLNKKEMAKRLGIPYGTYKAWTNNPSRNPLPNYVEKMKQFLAKLNNQPEHLTTSLPTEIPVSEQKEAKDRCFRLKLLLTLAMIDLAWFRDGSKEIRDVLRKELNSGDIGYVSSLLNMIQDEKSFQRWQCISTNTFQSFSQRRE